MLILKLVGAALVGFALGVSAGPMDGHTRASLAWICGFVGLVVVFVW